MMASMQDAHTHAAEPELEPQPESHAAGAEANGRGAKEPANQRSAVDHTKRKKLKARNIAALNSEFANASAIGLGGGSGGGGYTKAHLDSWLENCIRDASASNAQLSSSSEFLELNQLTGKQTFARWLQQQPKRSANAMRVHGGAASTNNLNFELGGQQRHMPNFPKPRSRVPSMFTLSDRFYEPNDDSQEFTSLPPIVDLMAAEHGERSLDVLDHEQPAEPSTSRRRSEPCLLNPSDDSKFSDQNTRNNDMDNGRVFGALMEQINLLHDTNSKICRNLQETRVDIEALKHSSSFAGMRQRRDSLSGLSTHSQPLIFGSGFGTHSPASTFHSGAYTPGMMTDVVREVKEAARVREDALLNRVKSMAEERQWALNEGNVRILRDLDELKRQVLQLRLERKETNRRLNHLEAENKYLRQMLVAIYHNRVSPDTIYEGEPVRLAKPSRRVPSFKANYGTVHGQARASSTYSIEESKDEVDPGAELPPSSSNSTTATNTPLSSDSLEREPTATVTAAADSVAGEGLPKLQSPPNFALVSTGPGTAARGAQQPVSNAQLKRDFEQAVAARNEATQRVIALEQKFSRNHRTSTATAPATGNGSRTTVPSRTTHAGSSSNNSNTATKRCPAQSSNNIRPFRTKFQQQQQQPHQHQKQAPTTPHSKINNTTPKLSVSAGPITDL